MRLVVHSGIQLWITVVGCLNIIFRAHEKEAIPVLLATDPRAVLQAFVGRVQKFSTAALEKPPHNGRQIAAKSTAPSGR
jgi:hypothetical protein